jgi:hypothetical protein
MSPSGGVSDAPIETAPGSASRDNPRAAFAPNLGNVSISLIDRRYFQADHVGHRVEHHFWCRLHLWLSLLLCMVGTRGLLRDVLLGSSPGIWIWRLRERQRLWSLEQLPTLPRRLPGPTRIPGLWCRQSHYISNISPFTTGRVLSN